MKSRIDDEIKLTWNLGSRSEHRRYSGVATERCAGVVDGNRAAEAPKNSSP